LLEKRANDHGLINLAKRIKKIIIASITLVTLVSTLEISSKTQKNSQKALPK
jgi:hypothetical protein